jgi:hypothetical protein
VERRREGGQDQPVDVDALGPGERHDVDSLATLIDSSGLSADEFVVRSKPYNEAEPLAMISTYLRADRSLSPQAAEALDKVVKATYDALKED